MAEHTHWGPRELLFIHATHTDKGERSPFFALERSEYIAVLQDDGYVITYPDRPPTADALCAQMDSDAEGENYHGLIGVPDTLCRYMKEAHIERKKIDAVMLSLYLDGGLMR